MLALPTGFMGATLPLLTRHAVKSDRELGPRVALLYATNTAGAVAGTVTAAFVLLPALGLNGTVWVGVAVNAAVFGIAVWLSRKAPPIAAAAESAGNASPVVQTIGFFESCIAPAFRRGLSLKARFAVAFVAQPGWILALILVSGANAFFYEVLWTRMLSHIMGGSIFAFATMLAAFLTGIALGGGLAGPVARDRERAALAFAVTQAAIAILSVGVYLWMGPLIPESRSTLPMAGMAVAVMLPATIFIGATFPLAVRILARTGREAGEVTAKIYSWNTVGAIVGAILAGVPAHSGSRLRGIHQARGDGQPRACAVGGGVRRAPQPRPCRRRGRGAPAGHRGLPAEPPASRDPRRCVRRHDDRDSGRVVLCGGPLVDGVPGRDPGHLRIAHQRASGGVGPGARRTAHAALPVVADGDPGRGAGRTPRTSS